jgi:hypothetical protein
MDDDDQVRRRSPPSFARRRTSTRPRNIHFALDPVSFPSFRPLLPRPLLHLHLLSPQDVPSVTAPWYVHPNSLLISTVHSHVSHPQGSNFILPRSATPRTATYRPFTYIEPIHIIVFFLQQPRNIPRRAKTLASRMASLRCRDGD